MHDLSDMVFYQTADFNTDMKYLKKYSHRLLQILKVFK